MEMQLTRGWERGQSERDRNLVFSHLRALDFILTGVGEGRKGDTVCGHKKQSKNKITPGNRRDKWERGQRRGQEKEDRIKTKYKAAQTFTN